MANVIGPDVSFYEDDPETPQGIDYKKMRASAGYVIIRAGQNAWVDSDFKLNWREAKLAGMPRGAYWFYDSRTEPKRQAELWVQQFAGDFGELPLFADLEETYMGPYRGWKNWYTFLERVKQLVPGKEIVIYTAYYYWRDNAPNATTQATNLEYFHQYPLWIANYGTAEPLIPKPWGKSEWLFWQYTESGDGKLYGTESNGVDLNYFNGDAAALKARFKLSDAPPPDPDPEPIPTGDTPTGRIYKVTALPSLKVREGPGVTYNAIGLLYPNETVEEINATTDRSWLKVRKSDGTLIGWSSSAYLTLSSGTPPPSEVKMYRVTASPSLKVREGPGLTYNSLGTLAFDTLVEELDANADRSWLKVKNSTGTLIGWSSAAYLTYTGSTTPTPSGKKMLRVLRTSTQVLEQPVLTAKLVGLIYFGEIVEEIDISTDGNWLNVRKTDGSITGWSLNKDLLSVDAPTPPTPEVPPTPVPDDTDKKWYRVGFASVNVRATASATGNILGTVLLDDTLPALDDTSDPNWIQIRRVDGLSGWCEKKYLIFLSSTRPASIRQNLFKGVTYLYKDLSLPRKNRMHVMAVDLQTAGLQFLVTPSANLNGIMCTRTVSKFLEEFGVNFAVNGDGFNYIDPTVEPTVTCSSGDRVKVNGFAASRGKIYSPKKTVEPTVYISSLNKVAVDGNQSSPFNAVTGDRVVVQNGVTVKNLAAAVPAPRTAIGLNKAGRWLIFMVVDGRQAGFSEGVTFPELADLLISYGVYTGVNMDGGGSSTMVIKGVDAKARLLNSPIDQNIPGKQRSVANHLGLFVK